MLPKGGPMERVAISRAFFDISLDFRNKSSSDKNKSHPSLEGPRKGASPLAPQNGALMETDAQFHSPLQVHFIELPQRDVPFPELSFIHLTKPLANEPITSSPTGPL